MSRVGKKPIPIPEKVKITLKDRFVTVKGNKGTLSRTIHDAVDLKISDNVIEVLTKTDSKKNFAPCKDLRAAWSIIWSPVSIKGSNAYWKSMALDTGPK
jgi:ribosomal protein L6P/L9E